MIASSGAMESCDYRLFNALLQQVVRAWEHILAALQSALLSLQGFARCSRGEAFSCGWLQKEARWKAEFAGFPMSCCAQSSMLRNFTESAFPCKGVGGRSLEVVQGIVRSLGR
jgi:hypothetical protein